MLRLAGGTRLVISVSHIHNQLCFEGFPMMMDYHPESPFIEVKLLRIKQCGGRKWLGNENTSHLVSALCVNRWEDP